MYVLLLYIIEVWENVRFQIDSMEGSVLIGVVAVKEPGC